MAKNFIAGIDLGGTKIMTALFDEKMKIVDRRKVRTDGGKGPKDTIGRMARLVRKSADEVGGVDSKLLYAGVGAPGPLRPGEGIIVAAPNLGWHNVPLKKMLETDLGCPVNVDNDVNMGTYGEYIAGAARGKKLVLGIFPGTGIGGGIVIDGKVIHGASGSAGEIGHVIVDYGGSLCGCGRRGCIETISSKLAVAREVAAAALRGQSPYMLEHHGTNIAKMKSGAFAAAIKAGDKVVEDIICHAARMLGLAAAGLVNVLSPDCIVLGGGLVEAMPKLFVDEVRRGIDDFAMPAIAPSVKVVAAALGDDAVVVGAAAYAGQVLQTA